MGERGDEQVTDLLQKWQKGRREAFDELVTLVYPELRALARKHMASERRDHTLQTTALVNEACVRLMGSEVAWNDRLHFFAVASRVMRRVLVDHARAHRSHKRGGDQVKLALDDVLDAAVERPWDLLDLDAALDKLHEHDERKAQAIELHYFGGLTYEQVAKVLDVTTDAAAWDMRLAKAWLKRELRGDG